MKIVINGGHDPRQGRDPGAIGPTGLWEAEVTRELMVLTKNQLAQQHECLAVQENELADIVDASNGFGADVFVSLHCNGADSPKAAGTETFCWRRGGRGELLAACLQRQVVKQLGMNDRGVKTADFFVLRETECPAALVEIAFITNSGEEAMLKKREKLQEFARAVAAGIEEYCQQTTL